MKSALAVAIGLAMLASVAAQQPARTRRPPSAPARPMPARVEPAVPFKVGETLTFDVSWSSVLVAGTAVATVTEKRPSSNSTAYYIVAEGRPVPLLQRLYNLYYKMDSLVDSFTLLSQRGSLYSEEGGTRRRGETKFDRGARRAAFEHEVQGARRLTDRVELAVPPSTQDGLATLYTLRTLAFKVGERASMPVADGGELYTVTVDTGAVEEVRVPAGTFPAWRLSGSIADAAGQQIWKNVGVWISSDARRLPVKLQAELPVGHFVLALREMR